MLSYGYIGCVPDKFPGEFQYIMRSLYLPFALRQPSLLGCMLYVASRRYIVLKGNGQDVFPIYKRMLQYKQCCLQILKVASNDESMINEATIALAIVMSSEAVGSSSLNIRSREL